MSGGGRSTGEWDRYPYMANLVEELVKELAPRPHRDSLPLIRDMLNGLARADRKGYISAGDDHEFSTAARWVDSVISLPVPGEET